MKYAAHGLVKIQDAKIRHMHTIASFVTTKVCINNRKKN